MLGRNTPKSKQFSYQPRYYDPAKDRESDQRHDFKGRKSSRLRKNSVRSTRLLLLFLALVLALIWLLAPERFNEPDLDSVEVEAGDAFIIHLDENDEMVIESVAIDSLKQREDELLDVPSP